VKARRVVLVAALLGLLVPLGVSAEAASSKIQRGNCRATISNGWGQDFYAYSYRTSSGSTSCGYMSASLVVIVPGGSRQYVSAKYSYSCAIAQGWPNALYVYQSFHFLRDGSVPDPGYTYQLTGDW
jgi:hypothetical protein